MVVKLVGHFLSAVWKSLEGLSRLWRYDTPHLSMTSSLSKCQTPSTAGNYNVTIRRNGTTVAECGVLEQNSGLTQDDHIYTFDCSGQGDSLLLYRRGSGVITVTEVVLDTWKTPGYSIYNRMFWPRSITLQANFKFRLIGSVCSNFWVKNTPCQCVMGLQLKVRLKGAGATQMQEIRWRLLARKTTC